MIKAVEKLEDLELGPEVMKVYGLLSPELRKFVDGLVGLAFARGVVETEKENLALLKNLGRKR